MDRICTFKLDEEQIFLLSNLLSDKFAELEGYMYLGRIHRFEHSIDTTRHLEHEKDLINSIMVQLEPIEKEIIENND